MTEEKGKIRPKEKKEKKEKSELKSRLTVALSPDSLGFLKGLEEYHRNETSSEVVREAIWLAYTVMEAQKAGKRIELIDPKDPGYRKILTATGQLIQA